MSEAISIERTPLDQATAALVRLGQFIFSFAIAALGVETLVCARDVSHTLGSQYEVIPVIPWLPSIPWLAWVFGAILIVCAVGLLFRRAMRTAALTLGSLLFLCAIVLVAPKYAADIGSVSLRTVVFEPLAIASMAWLFSGRGAIPAWLDRGARDLLALSFIVFGVDHFLALAPIASLIPGWIPWHVFWIAFFGAAFIAAGSSIGIDWLLLPGAVGCGLMFAIWVVTLHLPRVLGLYGIPGAPRDPDEWSSLLIAVAMWGGSWALARYSVATTLEST
jgi:uncharacterized membrane protein